VKTKNKNRKENPKNDCRRSVQMKKDAYSKLWHIIVGLHR